MGPASADLSAVVSRVERLEKENHRLKIAAVAGLFLLSCGAMKGQAAPAGKKLEAEEILLRDAAGIVRVRMGNEQSATGVPMPGLFLYDANGKLRGRLGMGKNDSSHLDLLDARERATATLAVDGDGRSSLSLYDGKSGSPRLSLDADPDETRFRLFDANGNMRTALDSKGDDTATLTFLDRGARARGMFTVTADGVPQLSLWGSDSTEVALTVHEGGTGVFLYRAKQSRPSAALMVGADGSPSLTIADASGKIRWQTP
ncbi:MAG: hypothetical protein HY049_10570 [Acidobacteria bacterium]|nr:hypothetical protein [Acidobacteriota bacterium]